MAAGPAGQCCFGGERRAGREIQTKAAAAGVSSVSIPLKPEEQKAMEVGEGVGTLQQGPR